MNDLLTYYYVPVPVKPEDRHRLDGLLNGLEPYYDLETRDVIQVSASHPTLDPILSKLAQHVIRPIHPELPSAPQGDQDGHKKIQHSGTRKSYTYTLPSGKKLNKKEMQAKLDLEEIEIGTRIQHFRMGEMVVVQNGEKYVLEPVETAAD